MAYLSIVNNSGRLFDKTVNLKSNSEVKDDGLLVTIDYSNNWSSSRTTDRSSTQKTRAYGVAFNDVGDQFLVTDSRGSVMMYYISQNRYICIARNANAAEKWAFISNPGTEHVIVANNDNTMNIYTAKGKLLSTLKGHRSSIKKFCMNTKHWMMMSLSKDVINLWNRDKHTKIRSIFAQYSYFEDSRFTPDGSKIITLLNDSDIHVWNLSNFEQLQSIKHSKELQLTWIDWTSKYLAWAGNKPFILLYDIENYFNNECLPLKIFQLPDGISREVTKLQFLRDSNKYCRLAMLIQGVFVLVQVISNDQFQEFKVEDQENPESCLKILASIRLPHVSILDFDIDRNNYNVSLVSSDGLARVYDINKLQSSDDSVTKQQVRLSSRETVSYYKHFNEINLDQMLENLKSHILSGIEQGTTFDDSFKMKDPTSAAKIGENTFDRLDMSKQSW